MQQRSCASCLCPVPQLLQHCFYQDDLPFVRTCCLLADEKGQAISPLSGSEGVFD
jgi:hypothetical protein